MSSYGFQAIVPERGNGNMGTERAAALVDMLDGTGVDATSSTLLDDMIAAKEDFPTISAWLDNLPGFSSGNREKAAEQLGYLTMQISAVLRHHEDRQ
ncbi:MAG: hypothetical protein IBX58_15130 [Roseovarius sp.]|nr:hypothetical protein [Roseovarius sp.]